MYKKVTHVLKELANMEFVFHINNQVQYAHLMLTVDQGSGVIFKQNHVNKQYLQEANVQIQQTFNKKHQNVVMKHIVSMEDVFYHIQFQMDKTQEFQNKYLKTLLIDYVFTHLPMRQEGQHGNVCLDLLVATRHQ